jgi:hypothetical protein
MSATRARIWEGQGCCPEKMQPPINSLWKQLHRQVLQHGKVKQLEGCTLSVCLSLDKGANEYILLHTHSTEHHEEVKWGGSKHTREWLLTHIVKRKNESGRVIVTVFLIKRNLRKRKTAENILIVCVYKLKLKIHNRLKILTISGQKTSQRELLVHLFCLDFQGDSNAFCE